MTPTTAPVIAQASARCHACPALAAAQTMTALAVTAAIGISQMMAS